MNIMEIEASSISNGEGWRVVLWCAGCSHHCDDCQNPETWSPIAGRPFTEADEQLIFKLLDHNYIHGITLSGGDPLYPANIKDMTDLAKDIKSKFPDKDIWCYTGYKWEEVYWLPIMKYIDVLVDGEYQKDKRDISLAFRGSSNQRIINVQKSLESGKMIQIEF